MAAGEHQPQPVVGYPSVTVIGFVFVREPRHRHFLQFGRADSGAAQPIQRPVSGSRLQPAGGAGRNPIARPPLQGLGESVLGALLCQIPVAGDADQIRDDPSPLGPKSLGDRRLGWCYLSQTGRTSIDPHCAPGICDATSIASSRSWQSTTYKPPICSFVSANGPSAMTTSPLRTRTVVAVTVGRSRSPSSRTTPRASIEPANALYASNLTDCSTPLTSTLSSLQTNRAYRIAPPN